ncbi:hypothetical protein P7C71_g2758, partial [Lecanoromycetidae sp. Uapishka_2]
MWLNSSRWVYYGDDSGLYNTGSSTTFSYQTAGFESTIGPSGYWAKDDVALAEVNVDSAWIGMVNGSGRGQGGAMGMAPSSSAKNQYGTPPKGIQEPWSATLARSLESPIAGFNIYNGEPGPVTFGYLDSTQYDGEPAWVAVDTSEAAWNIKEVYFSIDGNKTTASSGLPVLLDTGGLTVSFDKAIVEEYYSKIPSAQDTSNGAMSSWTVACDAIMPDLDIGFNEGQWDSVAKIYGAQLIDYLMYSSDTGTCGTNFAARDGNNFGPPFWMSNYVALNFDANKPQAGFAPKKVTSAIPGAITAPATAPIVTTVASVASDLP